MIRRPLRPLGRILAARSRGEDPDKIEAIERVRRNRQIQIKMRERAESRLIILSVCFVLAYGAVITKMGMIATSDPAEPSNTFGGPSIVAARADIVDRKGRLLATNLATASLYAEPHKMVDKEAAAAGLAKIFPDMKKDQLLKRFNSGSTFMFLRPKISPEQEQMVMDIGEPGLKFGERELRLYPNGRFASHILGGSQFGQQSVRAAEVVGTAGVEKWFDTFLRDPEQNGKPLELSIDMSVQSALETVLSGGYKIMNAKGASAVLMEADTGQIIAMSSMPDFDPNHRPNPQVKGDPADSPLFNRAAQGRYELGSTFKIFTAAMAIDQGKANPNSGINTISPLKWGKFTIRDFHNYGNELSLTDVIVKSSNTGTARLAKALGTKAQQEFLRDIGMTEAIPVELSEAVRTKPLIPNPWSELSTMTISYGHGLAATPLHLATAYATLTNGGLRVRPTLIKSDLRPTEADRVIKEKTSAEIRKMLRAVVTRGTASLGDVAGYEVGGKTGTADKPKHSGGYYKDKVIATFASIFPASNPKYVLVVTLDEPEDRTGPKPRRTAGWTAVPVGAEIIRRVAPLLDMQPSYITAQYGN